MPCACQVPVPNYPENAEWGPILWEILHGIAECAGRAVLPDDEVREWQKFVKLTGDILPCDKCRPHYAAYLKLHPATHFAKIPYSSLKTSVKTFFWELHNEVNTDNGKPVFSYDDLPARYNKVNLQDLFWRLDPVMKKTIQLNGISLLKWTNWIHSFKMMRAILSA